MSEPPFKITVPTVGVALTATSTSVVQSSATTSFKTIPVPKRTIMPIVRIISQGIDFSIFLIIVLFQILNSNQLWPRPY